jgi:hypothetical protein
MNENLFELALELALKLKLALLLYKANVIFNPHLLK